MTRRAVPFQLSVYPEDKAAIQAYAKSKDIPMAQAVREAWRLFAAVQRGDFSGGGMVYVRGCSPTSGVVKDNEYGADYR